MHHGAAVMRKERVTTPLVDEDFLRIVTSCEAAEQSASPMPLRAEPPTSGKAKNCALRPEPHGNTTGCDGYWNHIICKAPTDTIIRILGKNRIWMLLGKALKLVVAKSEDQARGCGN
mmetsp:Transcript_72153/g.136244  ORF Transcript_72153/g.136244 Transcript_72153/m.136244 type:complete len:117 (+) Transcript_72153:568-918(+)